MSALPTYWIDANVLITAKDGPFRFSINPAFWAALDSQVNAKRIRAPQMVYEEIVKAGHEDELAKWVRVRRTSGMFVKASKEVQVKFQTIADHVVQHYEGYHVAEFLSVADPWLIAHAMEGHGTVVTFENRQPGARRVKIPNVCAALDVPFLNPYDMLQALNIKFT
jgi:hypothetical protein